jgi:hypothetical protein
MIGMGMMGKSWFTLLPLLPPERTQIKKTDSEDRLS